MRGSRRLPIRAMIGSFTAAVLLFFGYILVLVSAFLFIKNAFGFEIAFLSLGLLTMLTGVLVHIVTQEKKLNSNDVPEEDRDVVSELVPETLANDPHFIELVEKIREHPLGSTSVALAIGVVISREFLADS